MDYVDVDPIFSKHIDEDFDELQDGISMKSFAKVYGKWISHCMAEKIKEFVLTLTNINIFQIWENYTYT
jgi:hypothetical protein